MTNTPKLKKPLATFFAQNALNTNLTMDNTTAEAAAWSSDKKEPLTSGVAGQEQHVWKKEDKINEKLNTDYVDVKPDDTSLFARLTRAIAGFVGTMFTPRQMIIILRVLKAVTVSFVCFTIVADLMYVFFVELFASNEVATKVGGRRDIVVRLYGLVLAVMALLVELDHSAVDKNFPIVKGFIPRGLLLFFICAITSPNPLHESGDLNNDKNNDDDDDDGYDNYDYDERVTSEIPNSTIVFQMVTSFVLGLCAFVYFSLGVLCFDRFTSKAFLSKTDPLKATAIPTPTNVTAITVHTESSQAAQYHL